MRKIFCITTILAILLSLNVAASFGEITQKVFHDKFEYTEKPLPIIMKNKEYIIGELSSSDIKGKIFTSGYVISTKVDKETREKVKPFFKMNLTKNEWLELSKFNEKLLNDGSFLGDITRNILINSLSGNEKSEYFKNSKITLSDIEIARKINVGKKYAYVIGSEVDFDSKGLEFPMYMRAYIYPCGNEIGVIMLVTRSEGKSILLYAFDDITMRLINGE